MSGEQLRVTWISVWTWRLTLDVHPVDLELRADAVRAVGLGQGDGQREVEQRPVEVVAPHRTHAPLPTEPRMSTPSSVDLCGSIRMAPLTISS